MTHEHFYHVGGKGMRFLLIGGTGNTMSIRGGEITDTDWHHIALCKVGDTWGIYKDGEQVAYSGEANSTAFAARNGFGGCRP